MAPSMTSLRVSLRGGRRVRGLAGAGARVGAAIIASDKRASCPRVKAPCAFYHWVACRPMKSAASSRALCQASPAMPVRASHALLRRVDEEQPAKRPRGLRADVLLGLLIDDQHGTASVRRFGRCYQSGKSGTNDQHVCNVEHGRHLNPLDTTMYREVMCKRNHVVGADGPPCRPPSCCCSRGGRRSDVRPFTSVAPYG